jgi:hypothetical protein
MQPTILYGGANYSASTFAEIIDATGVGAQIALTIVGGAVTAAVLTGTLTGYTAPVVNVVDPSGAGGNAVIQLLVQNLATVNATSGVFTGQPGFGAAGDVIRYGGGILQVIHGISGSSVMVNVQRSVPMLPDDPFFTAIPAPAGQWTIAAPTNTVQGLNHLEGMQVSVLADGNLVTPQTVVNGTVFLPHDATSVLVGLGYTAQLQTLYLDLPGPVTVQGRRKELDQAIIRVTSSATPFDVGANQPDASLNPGKSATWSNMTPIQQQVHGSHPPLQPFDLMTGDLYVVPFDGLGSDRGQLAIQQTQPLPLTVTAVMPWVRVMDDVDV